MNMKTISALGLGSVLAICSTSQAYISVSATLWPLNDVNDNMPAQPCFTVAIVDRDNDGFAGWDFSADPLVDNTTVHHDSFLFDSDDWVIVDYYNGNGVWNETAEALPGYYNYLASNTHSFLLEENGGIEGVNQGDAIYLFWFPTLLADATAPGMGTPFGVTYLDILPGDTGTASPNNVGVSPSAAMYVTVPEPATMGLLGAGSLCLVRRRRKE